MARRRDHDTGPNGITVDDLIDGLFPIVDNLLSRVEGDEFTTNDFIDLMLAVPEGVAAYEQAIVHWGEGERHSKMVVHGQAIPGAMRRSKRVEWTGYAHGENDEFGVPAWWRLTGVT
ncbi:MAG TPA: hypothetical protein VFQ54_03430 [Thermomicrobiales bacterium]|nr:hypothetical protein [Thermomicrobiales bacterium]